MTPNNIQPSESYHVENFRRRTRYTFVFALLIAAFFLICVLNINTGNVPIPIPRILKILLHRSGNRHDVNIIWKIRLPRILMSAMLGGGCRTNGSSFFYWSTL